MKHVSRAAASRRTHDTGFVAPGVTGEATEALEMTLAEYRATQKAPRQRNDAEYEMQCALIAWRDALVGQYPVLGALVHIPNGEYRTKRSAARIKALGGQRGLPDLILFVPKLQRGESGLYFAPGLCIECKVGRNQMSAEQKQWRATLMYATFSYEVVYDDWTIAARLVAAWCGLDEGLVP